MAFLGVNVLAVLLFSLRPGRSHVEKWLPFVGYTGAGLGSWLANTTAGLHLNLWFLGVALLAELFVLIAAGVLSSRVLRQVATIEPLNRVAIPLAHDDPDVVLDMQAAFKRCWEAGPYPELLQYNEPPPGELSASQSAWCRERDGNRDRYQPGRRR